MKLQDMELCLEIRFNLGNLVIVEQGKSSLKQTPSLEDKVHSPVMRSIGGMP
jgi:hypothetical protein